MKNENLNAYTGAYTEAFPYHWDETLLLQGYIGKLLEHLRGRRLDRLLSLGIGGQLVSRALIDHSSAAEYHIVEGSDEIIAQYLAQVNPPESVIIHHAYFENISFPPQHFGALEMGFVLEHVDDPLLVLERFRETLVKDGLLFAAVPNARSLHRLIGHAAGLLDDIYALSPADRELGHKRYFDADSIAALIERAGYRVLARYGLVMKPLTTSQLRSLDPAPHLEQALIKVGYDHPDLANGVLVVAERA
jgi:SAM-dependent methyltransferase